MAERQITLMQGSMEAASRALPAIEPVSLASVLGVRARTQNRKGDTRGFYLRRILLLADILALIAAFLAAELGVGFEARRPDTPKRDALLLAIAIPGRGIF